MKFFVTNSVDSADEGALRSAFIYGKYNVEVELQCDVNLAVTQPFTFFNAPSSFTINTNGHSCVINGAGFVFKDMSFVSVSGITFYNFTGDGIQLNNVKKHIVKNNTFVGHIATSDEAVSSVKGSGFEGGEICWNLFSKVNKGILCGTGDAGDEILDISQNISIHHNWFYDFERRAPYCRYGKYQIYNNVFQGWKYRNDQTFCIWAEDNATAFVLSNAFIQDKYSWFDGFPKRLFSWFTKRPWSMDQGTIARFGATINLEDNYKNCDWIKLEGVSGAPTVAPAGYELYSDTMIATVKAKAGSGIS